MQLLHDASSIRQTVHRLTELRHSQSAQLAETEAKLQGCDRLLERARETEERLKSEVEGLKRSVEAGARAREAQAAEMGLQLAEARARQADFDVRYARMEETLRLAGERIQAAEERAQVAEERAQVAEERAQVAEGAVDAAATRAVEEYKNSEAFEVDAAEAGVEAYTIGFDDCKAKVARFFPELDLDAITAVDGEQAEEGPRGGVPSVEDPPVDAPASGGAVAGDDVPLAVIAVDP